MYQIILSQAHQETIYFYCYKFNLQYDSELHFKLCWLSSIVRPIIKILLVFIKGTMNKKNQIISHISTLCVRLTKNFSPFVSLESYLEKAYLGVSKSLYLRLWYPGRREKILCLLKLWLMCFLVSYFVRNSLDLRRWRKWE